MKRGFPGALKLDRLGVSCKAINCSDAGAGDLDVLTTHETSPRESHGDVSWVVSTLRSPVPASLQLMALQITPSLSSLRVPEHPRFTPSLLVLIQVTRQGRKR